MARAWTWPTPSTTIGRSAGRALRGGRAAGRSRSCGEPARVVEYRLDDPALAEDDRRYRLITTILEPEAAPAAELAALYPQRWELESALDELKTHQRGPRVVLRSKHPDGVYQEAYGHLCTHYAIRRVMHDAALQADLVPHRLSFIRSLRASRTQPGFSPPQPRPRPPAGDRRDPR